MFGRSSRRGLFPLIGEDLVIVCHYGQIVDLMRTHLLLMMSTLHNGKYDDAIVLDNAALRTIRYHLELLTTRSTVIIMKPQL